MYIIQGAVNQAGDGESRFETLLHLFAPLFLRNFQTKYEPRPFLLIFMPLHRLYTTYTVHIYWLWCIVCVYLTPLLPFSMNVTGAGKGVGRVKKYSILSSIA